MTKMKKYIFPVVLALMACMLNACSNEDIEIQRDVVINVRASSVIAPFTMQAQVGDLQSLSDGLEIRVQLLIYDANGNLVNEAVGDDSDRALTTLFLENYQSSARVSGLFIPEGDYTMIAITDVVSRQRNNILAASWAMSGEETLKTLELDFLRKDNRQGLVYANAILGIGKKEVHLPQSGEITIDPKPAGCLLFLHYENVQKVKGVYDRLGAVIDYVPGSVTFNEQGDFELKAVQPVNHNNKGFGLIHTFDVDKNTPSNSAQYYFAFPSAVENGRLQLAFYSVRGDAGSYSKIVNVSSAIGDEYELKIDFGADSDITKGNVETRKVN